MTLEITKILGRAKQDIYNLTKVFLMNKIILNKSVEVMVVNHIKEIIHVHNKSKYHFVCLFYQLTSFYNLSDFKNDALKYIYRWFTIIAKIDNFQYLELNNIIRILSSSELNISSELEVFNASDLWLSCESFDRSKFAQELFLKTRFPLLSDHVTKSLLKQNRNSNNSFHKSGECLVLMEEVLKNKEEFYRNKSTIYYTNRYCKSSKFNITLCGGYIRDLCQQNMDIYDFEANSLQKVKKYAQGKKLKIYGAVSIRNELYLLCSNINDAANVKISFFRHSPLLKNWEEIEFFYERKLYNFCLCSFLESVFIIGGYHGFINGDRIVRRSCVVFDTSTKKWKEVAKMNDCRIHAASTVFEGRVVVSGGYYITNRRLSSVEAYDHVADEWSYMPSMINESCDHNMLAVSNKLFAIGCGEDYDICEVYDSISKKFVVLSSFLTFFSGFNDTSITIGRKIMVIRNHARKVAIYDVDKNEWSEESFEDTRYYRNFNCIKIPSLKY